MRALPDLHSDARFWLSRRLGRSLAPPDWLSINLTLRCNLACVMCTTCYDAPELGRDEVLDLIDQAADWGVRVFNPLGGEPFVRQDLEDILDHAARRDLFVTLTTNGTLISAARAARVARIPPEKLHVNVSLDGLQATHDGVRGEGAFARTLAGYERLRAADAERGNAVRTIGANVILHRKNLAEFPALLDHLAARGFEGVQILHLFRDERDPTVGGMWFEPDDLPALDALVARLVGGASPVRIRNRVEDLALVPRYYREGLGPLEAPCWAGWKELYVNADGSAIMCDGKLDFLAGRYGSVREHTLRELWRSPTLAARREVVKQCTTPCVQACYLRRESDSGREIAAGYATHAVAAVRSRLGALLPRGLAAEVLTLELSDTPDDPDDPRAARLFATSPVGLAALHAAPERLVELRDRHYLDFGRGFFGVELLDRLLADLRGAGLRFGAVAVTWRGEPLLHPELEVVLDRLVAARGEGLFTRLVVETTGRLLDAPRAHALARSGAEVWVTDPAYAARAPLAGATVGRPALPDGPAVSWDARLTASRADVRLEHKLGNVLEEGFGPVWARAG